MFKYIIFFLTIVLSSCGSEVKKEPQKDASNGFESTDLTEVLNNCKGNAIVVACGFNPEYITGRQHSLLIRDDATNTVYGYRGVNLVVTVGDTLKYKQK